MQNSVNNLLLTFLKYYVQTVSGKKLSGETQCVSDPTEVPKPECDSQLTFKCASGRCIPKHFQCDKENDCLDNSDETNCDTGKSYCRANQE